jgi:lysophospholipase L1-like esterase
MLRARSFLNYRRVLALLAVVALMQGVGHGQAQRPRRIAGFGSSVANGSGDETAREGYIGLLRTLMAARGWEVLNQSRGGDTTKTMATRWAPDATSDPKVRYLKPVNPGYVILALSLSNEGVWEAKTLDDKQAIYQQYADGIRGFVTKARQENIVPIVALCYPRLVYTPTEYEYLKRMNIEQSMWDVPSVNFLGAADDGAGRWADGFMYNDKHPNASGHRELMLAFVPTLFEALEKGKPTPTKPASGGFARISDGAAPLTFVPDATMHSFAVSMMVRSQGDGTVASVGGSTLAAKMEEKKNGTGQSITEFREITLTADRPFTSTVGIQNGKWTYRSATGVNLTSAASADAGWHHVVLSHYTARGETLFFIDGVLVGKLAERLEPNRFVIGGPGTPGSGSAPKQADYKDVFVFRAALNADEVAVLTQGKILQASLEVYSPLVDAQFRPETLAENRAQSLSGLRVGPGRIVHVEESTSRNQ